MELIISIDLENEAFQDSLANLEIANILQQLCHDYQNGVAMERNIRDSNGNTVGYIKLEG